MLVLWKCISSCTGFSEALLEMLHSAPDFMPTVQNQLLAIIFLSSEVVLLRDKKVILVVVFLPLCIGKTR